MDKLDVEIAQVHAQVVLTAAVVGIIDREAEYNFEGYAARGGMNDYALDDPAKKLDQPVFNSDHPANLYDPAYRLDKPLAESSSDNPTNFDYPANFNNPAYQLDKSLVESKSNNSTDFAYPANLKDRAYSPDQRMAESNYPVNSPDQPTDTSNSGDPANSGHPANLNDPANPSSQPEAGSLPPFEPSHFSDYTTPEAVQDERF